MRRQTDLELLRAFEPILRYTSGEFFFPMAVDAYLAECDLWTESPDGKRVRLAAVGEISPDNLAQWKERAHGHSLWLRYVQEPINRLDSGGHVDPPRPHLHAPSRLARVGILARLIDAGFDLSLILRGSVPGGTVAAAEVKYARARSADPVPRYHGRIIRQAGWTICHYLYFYAMNDWRSSFAGANDHEADWEQSFVFLEERPDGTHVPVWFARAAHDEVGADLRRRWDDPLLLREGDHPIIFAGAGSHAAYIEPGEYLQEVPLRLPRPLAAVMAGAQALWSGVLRQGSGRRQASERFAAVAFVDYARGDGLSVGPGQDTRWGVVPIDDTTPWVSGYDGLFGLDTRDRFAGERAPAGPMFTRDGLPRQSWIDPVGFAGLEAEVPPGQRESTLLSESATLAAELEQVEREIELRQESAQRLGLRMDASRLSGRSASTIAPIATARDDAIATVASLRRRAHDLRITIRDTDTELERVRAGDLGDPRRHLRFVAHPQDPAEINRSRLLDIWSAVGIALALLVLGGVVVLGLEQWWIAMLLVVGGYAIIEALVRGRVLVLLLNVTVVQAVIGSVILLANYWLTALAILVVVIGFLILRDNVGELRRTIRR